MAKRPQRPSISKRRRFEIFKRDGFVCQYCGRHPPTVVLEIDHIVAVANGGPGDDDNLVAACFDCNRGKGAVSLSAVPQSLADKAAEVAEREQQLLGYNAILQERRDRLEDDVWRIFEALEGAQETTKRRFQSVRMFVDRLGLHEVLDAVDVTHRAGLVYPGKGQFLYFCKVCWNKINGTGPAAPVGPES